jgi:hypothetical protein
MGGLALALASKESAAFLPAWFLYMEVAVWRRRPSAVTLSCALLGALFVIWRWHGGSPYSSDLSPWTIPPNLLYYAGVSLAGVPEHYAYRSGLGLWRSSPVLGVASVAMVTAAWLALLAGKRVRRPSGAARPLVTAGVGWAVCALLPVIGVAAGRTLYVPSIGLAWVLAGLALEVPPRRAATAVALMVSAGLLQTRDRVAYWNMAGEVTAGLIRSVEVVRAESPDAVVCLEDLPDHVRHAYVFRNALPALNEVMWPAGRVVEAKGQGEECDVRVSPPPAH